MFGPNSSETRTFDVCAFVPFAFLDASFARTVSVALHLDSATASASCPLALEIDTFVRDVLLDAPIARSFAVALDFATVTVGTGEANSLPLPLNGDGWERLYECIWRRKRREVVVIFWCWRR